MSTHSLGTLPAYSSTGYKHAAWTVHHIDNGIYSSETYPSIEAAEVALAELAGEPGERWATIGREA